MERMIGMKKVLIFTLALVLGVTALFTGCGSKGQESGSSIVNESESQGAGKGIESEAEEEALPGEDWKLQFVELVPEREGKFGGFAQTKGAVFADFRSVSMEGGQYILNYTMESELMKNETDRLIGMTIDMPDYYSPRSLCSDGKNYLYMLASHTENEDEQFYLIYKIDAGNGDTEYKDISEDWKETFGEETGQVKAAADEKGNVYLASLRENSKILVLGEEGTYNVLLPGGCILYDITCVDSRIYCVGNTGNNPQKEMMLFCVDTQKKALEETAVLPGSSAGMMLRPGQNGTILYGYNDAVYQYDPVTKSGEDIYAWGNLGIDIHNVEDFFMDSEGRLCVLPQMEEKAILMIMKRPGSGGGADGENTEKETVLIYGSQRDRDLVKAIVGFNLSSDQYEVQMKEYEDSSRILTELMTGKGPDLFPPRIVGISECVRKGIIEDLNPYLDSGDRLSRSMLNEKVLELYTVDGQLTCIPASFYIDTLLGKSAILGRDEPGWTLEEFLACVDAHRGITIVEGGLQGSSRENLMYMMWKARRNQWVDWDNGIAHFDDEEFGTLLRFAKDYEALYDADTADTHARWRENKILLYGRPVSQMDFYLWYQEVAEGDMVAIGYPTQDGKPYNLLRGEGDYAINSSSSHKEGAWAFIEYLVSSQTPKETFGNGIPTLNAAFETMLKNSMKETGVRYDDYVIPAATEEDIAKYREIIENAKAYDDGSSMVESILAEELEFCFEGGRSVEDTIEIIQKRVQLYLDEIR